MSVARVLLAFVILFEIVFEVACVLVGLAIVGLIGRVVWWMLFA